MGKHEVVIAGGGHNGLVVAAYLARAGVDVCVVEMQDKVGGAVRTAELTVPGFKHDPFSLEHGLLQANPLIQQATEAGVLDAETALLYRVYEAADPDHLPAEYRHVSTLPRLVPPAATGLVLGCNNEIDSSLRRLLERFVLGQPVSLRERHGAHALVVHAIA